MPEEDLPTPAGVEIGIAPIRSTKAVIPPLSSRDVLTNPLPYNDASSSEWGGVAGLVQPFPHVPTAKERLRQVYAIDPCDDGTEPTSIRPPVLDGDFYG